MALIYCRECLNQVSNKEATCPHCGEQLKNPYALLESVLEVLIPLVVLVFLLAVFAVVIGGAIWLISTQKPRIMLIGIFVLVCLVAGIIIAERERRTKKDIK